MKALNLVFMGSFNGFELYTRSYGKKLHSYLVPSRIDVDSLDLLDLGLYKISSTLALEFMNMNQKKN